MSGTPILSVDTISKRFVRRADLASRMAGFFGAPVADEIVTAVDDVNLSIAEGEVLGLVGESGCGKSTLGRMICGLMRPSEGVIRYRGRDISAMSAADSRDANLAIQMVFQDPMASLNPRMRIDEIVAEAPVVHGIVAHARRDEYVAEMLTRVGLHPDFMRRFPHQLSGGQRARVGIARALAVKPRIIVCDEAVAALDVSIQAQILNLFLDLRRELGLTYLFVSHDLGVVEHIADRVAVMYLGRIVERAGAEALFTNANHPYARALLAEVPRIEERGRKFTALKGEIPSPLHPPAGCHFHPRCPHRMPVCETGRPPLLPVGPEHHSACRLNEIALSSAAPQTTA